MTGPARPDVEGIKAMCAIPFAGTDGVRHFGVADVLALVEWCEALEVAVRDADHICALCAEGQTCYHRYLRALLPPPAPR